MAHIHLDTVSERGIKNGDWVRAERPTAGSRLRQNSTREYDPIRFGCFTVGGGTIP